MGEVIRKMILFSFVLHAAHCLPTGGEEAAALQPALGWLIGRRGLDFGWGADTPRALLALIRAGPQAAGWDPNSLEGQLSTKQLEIELLTTLLKKKNGDEGQHLGVMAHYSLALTALCRDPKEFYGFDIIGEAVIPEDPQHAFTFAFNMLSVCASGSHVKRRNIRKLLEITENPSSESLHNTDTLAMVVMATACIARNSSRHRNLYSFLEQPLLQIAAKQHEDGSFDSNIPSTALAYQALQLASSLSISANGSLPQWRPEAALNWIKAQQKADGSFGDVFITTEALMALSNRGYAAIHWDDCLADGNENATLLKMAKDVNIAPSVANAQTNYIGTVVNIILGSTQKAAAAKNSITFNYVLWIGQNRSEQHDIQLNIKPNTTFFEAMKIAAEQNPNYEFSATVWPNGHYVHTIGGHKEVAVGFHFWLLFRLPFRPDPEHPPPTTYVAPGGVDDMYPEEGDYFLFWFKNV